MNTHTLNDTTYTIEQYRADVIDQHYDHRPRKLEVGAQVWTCPECDTDHSSAGACRGCGAETVLLGETTRPYVHTPPPPTERDLEYRRRQWDYQMRIARLPAPAPLRDETGGKDA